MLAYSLHKGTSTRFAEKNEMVQEAFEATSPMRSLISNPTHTALLLHEEQLHQHQHLFTKRTILLLTDTCP